MNNGIVGNLLLQIKKAITEYSLLIYTLLIFSAAAFLYLPNYDQPTGNIWDEVYFIPVAQRYLHGTAFVQEHPPLGKLFIALGERIFDDNRNVPEEFLETRNSIKQFPKDYSFRGARFFPVIFGILAATAFFWLLCYLLGSELQAFLFSIIYLFDNALIADSRGALLQSTQLFFMFLALIYFFHLYNKITPKPKNNLQDQRTDATLSFNLKQIIFKDFPNSISLKEYFFLGILISLPILVKVNAVFLLLVFLFLYLKENSLYLDDFVARLSNIRFLGNLSKKLSIFILGIIISSGIVYGIHGSLSKHIVGDQFTQYLGDGNYKNYLEGKENLKPQGVLEMYYLNIVYIFGYHGSVPELTLENFANSRNGSYPITWPVGGRSILYAYNTENDKSRYVYLIGNPISWWIGLLAVILSIILVGSRYIFGLKVKNKDIFEKIQIILLLYLIYMFVMLNVIRVMYLYHYLMPLSLSYILAALLFQYIFTEQLKVPKIKFFLYGLVSCGCLIIIAVFAFFSPLTYFQPLSDKEFEARRWMGVWDLEKADIKLKRLIPESTKENEFVSDTRASPGPKT